MALRIVGAGLGRTGTHSLKLALERLLGAPCYHMADIVTKHREHIDVWRRAGARDLPDWDELFDGYAAAVDMPVAFFWRELMSEYPDAPILLSLRNSESWWESAHATIMRPGRERTPEFAAMMTALYEDRFTTDVEGKASAIAAYEAHNAAVMAEVPGERLIVWRTGDGWGPLCRALDLPVPAEPFPHSNTTAEFRARPMARPSAESAGPRAGLFEPVCLRRPGGCSG